MPNGRHIHRGRPCEVESHAALSLPPMTATCCCGLPTVAPCRGFRFSGRAGCWPWPRVSVCRPWRSRRNATPRRSGGFAVTTSKRDWPGAWQTRLGPVIRLKFPPLARAQIVQLACLEPIAKGLHITPWSSRELARQAVADGIVPHLDARTVRRILHAVDLQPHRTRYWKTARVDADFKRRAEQILWCYANANRLMERGFLVVCADEMPNLQALARHPIRRALPGAIEQQEFEYVRHGTAWSEYNRLYAHPFESTWSNQKMRTWFARHAIQPA